MKKIKINERGGKASFPTGIQQEKLPKNPSTMSITVFFTTRSNPNTSSLLFGTTLKVSPYLVSFFSSSPMSSTSLLFKKCVLHYSCMVIVVFCFY
jgi:hypothetical protein